MRNHFKCGIYGKGYTIHVHVKYFARKCWLIGPIEMHSDVWYSCYFQDKLFDCSLKKVRGAVTVTRHQRAPRPTTASAGDGDWEAVGKTWQLPFVGGDLLHSEGGFKTHPSARTDRSESAFPAPACPQKNTRSRRNMEKSGSVDSLGSKRSSSRQPSVDSLSRQPSPPRRLPRS